MTKKRASKKTARKKATKKRSTKRSSRVTRRGRSRRSGRARAWIWPFWIAVGLGVFGAGYYLGGGFGDWFPGRQGEEVGRHTESSTEPSQKKQTDEGAQAPKQRPESTPETGEYPVPEVARAEPPASDGSLEAVVGTARIALVIDDLGRRVSDVTDIAELGVPVTYAVLPFEVRTPQVVAAIRERGYEMICHLPMQPATGANPGPGALRDEMSTGELAVAAAAAIDAVPGAVGVNNHMGSKLSTNREAMEAIMTVVDSRDLYFLDSRTSAQSVGFATARRFGVPTVERQVFLDGERTEEWIAGQFRRAMDIAKRDGYAVVIGHPHAVTIDTLREWVPKASEAGFEFVTASALLERSGAPAG